MWKMCIIFNLGAAISCWDRTIGLIASGRMPVKKIISHMEPLAEWERVFDDVESKRGPKAILIP